MLSRNRPLCLFIVVSVLLSSAGAQGLVIPFDYSQAIAVENVADGEVRLGGDPIWLGEDGAGRQQLVGIRFKGIALEQNAKIQSARLQFQSAAEGQEDTCNLHILGVYSADAAMWTPVKRGISSRTATVAMVNWEVPVWRQGGQAGPDQRTPDLAEIVNEILGHPEWEKGSSMAFIITGSGSRRVAGDRDAVLALHLEGDVPVFTEKSYTVRQETDCAEEFIVNGLVSLYSSDLELGHDEGQEQVVGIRFAGIDLRRDDSVVEARIQFQCDQTKGGEQPCEVMITGQRSADAATFSAAAKDLSQRPVTENRVTWRVEPWTKVDERGAAQQTVNLAPLINEIMALPDWRPGNAMVFFFQATGLRCAEAYRSSHGRPTLTITTSRLDYLVSFAGDGRTVPERDDVVQIPVRLNRAAAVDVSVPYSLDYISAEPNDVSGEGPEGRLLFPAGTTERFIEFSIRDDRIFEPDEQVTIRLESPVTQNRDGGIGLGLHRVHSVRISGNDFPPEIALKSERLRLREEEGAVRVKVTLSEAVRQPVSVEYAVEPVTAQAADFAGATAGTVVFEAGQTEAAITLRLNDDGEKETLETARLVLRHPRGGNRYGTARLGRSSCELRIAASDYPADWPMYRFDAGRSGAGPVSLAEQLHLQWVMELPQLEPAWDEQDPTEDSSGAYERRFTYDRAYAPVIVGKKMLIGSSYDDSVRAYDTETKKELWCYYADGPVRFAPAVYDDKVYFCSDDGYVYCLGLADGGVIWRFRAAPAGRKLIGNHRLASMWPSRGGVCIENDKLYVAAGIFPFMGTFIYELDPQTGEVNWCNDGSGSLFVYQPHATSAKSFGAVAPQGYLVATDDYLLVPNGRACPAGFKRATGEFLYFRYGDRMNKGAESRNHVAAYGPYFQQGRKLLNIEDGFYYAPCGDGAVLTPEGYYQCRGDAVAFHRWDKTAVWSTPVKKPLVLIKAGERIYAGRKNAVIALDEEGRFCWEKRILGTPINMAAGDGKLIVAVEEGPIYCFGDIAEPAVELPDTILVAAGSVWRYLDDGSDQGDAWRKPDYDDGAWHRGPAELGYGDGDEATVTGYGDDSTNKHVTTYFRHVFNVENVETISRLHMRIFRDDGAIVYVNDREMLRTNMPAGEINYLSYARGGEEWVQADCDPCALRPGENVLAVELHQSSPGSSDLSFDLELSCSFKRSRRAVRWPEMDAATNQARLLVEMTGQQEGYCVVWGVGDGRLMEELARQTKMPVIGLDPDAEKVNALRGRWDRMKLPRKRVNAIAVDSFAEAGLPPYLANLIVRADPALALPPVEDMFAVLRPYGGTICLDGAAEDALRSAKAGKNLPKAMIELKGGEPLRRVLLRRVGPLPDSADWTHNYGDTAQTSMSRDKRVKTPMGLLHFGNTSNRGILPRHGHGPTELVAGGRVFVEGVHFLRAYDVYTGRLMWQKGLPKVGYFFRHTTHEAGANSIGSNYAVTEKDVYILYKGDILRLDAATGRTLKTFSLPDTTFSQVRVYDDLLVCTANPLMFDGGAVGTSDTWNWTCSRDLMVLNRYDGQMIWQLRAENTFHHNTLIIGANDILYCIDRIPPGVVNMRQRRGETLPDIPYILRALKVATGEPVWHITDPTRHEKVFGTWLAYSAEYDILVQSFRKSRDMVRGEPFGRLMTLNGSNGTILMEKETPEGAEAPFVLYHNMVICQGERTHYGSAFDIRTGEPIRVEHPLTGEMVDWTWTRAYGCNSAIACENLLTFRSGAAGFYDMNNWGGSGNFGGFKSGCTPSMVPANGVLNYPEYTRTCVCAYQNQTSLALVHMPDVEVWTYSTWPPPDPARPVVQGGLNFGAYGDRRAGNGTLWMEYPVSDVHDTGFNTSPHMPLTVEPGTLNVFRHHSSRYPDGSLDWVACSGIEGIQRLTIQPGGDGQTRLYTVRLLFSLPVDRLEETRVFDVSLQGMVVEPRLRISAQNRDEPPIFVRDYKNIPVDRELCIELNPIQGLTVLCGVEIILEDVERPLLETEHMPATSSR